MLRSAMVHGMPMQTRVRNEGLPAILWPRRDASIPVPQLTLQADHEPHSVTPSSTSSPSFSSSISTSHFRDRLRSGQSLLGLMTWRVEAEMPSMHADHLDHSLTTHSVGCCGLARETGERGPGAVSMCVIIRVNNWTISFTWWRVGRTRA